MARRRFSDTRFFRHDRSTNSISEPTLSGRRAIASNFLDVAGKVPYLAALGINVLQPLPIDEQEANPSMGYGGADLFSPDFPYVAAAADCRGYLATMNGLLAARRLAPLRLDDIRSGPAQLKVWWICAMSTASPFASTWSTITPAVSR